VDDIAATHYLVERIESDLLTQNRLLAWRTMNIRTGRAIPIPAMPEPSRPLVLPEADADQIRRNARGDLIRIMDREGNLVWWREFKSRESGEKKHSEIMDDLMKLSPTAFRGKYAIIPERPLDVDAAGEAAPRGPAPGSANDPNGPWADRVRRSEGGTEWPPDAGPGGAREGDVDWGDFGQR
jgi:hypothetical protein